MIKKGQLVKVTYKVNDSESTEYYIYVGEGIIDDKILFLKLKRFNSKITLVTFTFDEILNIEVHSNNYTSENFESFGFLNEGSDEKFRYWYMNRNSENCPSELKELCLYSPEVILAFKLFTFEQFKEYFMKDLVKTLFLVQILKNNFSSSYLDKFRGYDLSICNCLTTLDPKTEDELYAFIIFVNLNLNGYKRDTGLTEDDCKYFNQLERALLQGLNYTDYPRNELNPDTREIMWFYACSDILVLYIKLLNSGLHKNDIYKVFNNHYVSLLALDEGQLDTLLADSDNFEELYTLLYYISYRETLHEPNPRPYAGEFDVNILYTGFDDFRFKNKRRDNLIDF